MNYDYNLHEAYEAYEQRQDPIGDHLITLFNNLYATLYSLPIGAQRTELQQVLEDREHIYWELLSMRGYEEPPPGWVYIMIDGRRFIVPFHFFTHAPAA